MDRQTALNRAVAIAALRIVIGILSMMLAYHKIFVTGLAQEMRWFEELGRWFPQWLLWAVNIYAAIIELVCGFLLCIGLLRDWSGWAILSVLVIVTFGHSLEAEVWDIEQMVFRLALVCSFLLLPRDWDFLQIGTLWKSGAFRSGEKRA